MTVYFVCKSCEEKHPSPISFGDKDSFESATLKNNSFQCPKTGKLNTYDKEDMFWKE